MSLAPNTEQTVSTRVLDFSMRNVQFDIANCNPAAWHPAGLHVTHFFNALSVRFPEGEKFFINSVRHYRERITDPALLADIEAFIGQEAMHGRAHRGLNGALERAGYGADKMEQELKAQIKRMKMPPLFQLSVTCAAEHFTAIMSAVVLDTPEILDASTPNWRRCGAGTRWKKPNTRPWPTTCSCRCAKARSAVTYCAAR